MTVIQEDSMTTADVAALIRDVIYENDDAYQAVSSIRSYDEAGVLTTDDGLVIRDNAGNEFQVTVVQSR